MIETTYRGFVEPLVYPMRLGCKESFESATYVSTAYDGTEYRQMLRKIPRRSFSFELFVSDTNILNSAVMLDRNYTGKWALPIWMDAIKYNDTLLFSATEIVLPETSFWFQSESIALVYESFDKWEVVDVEVYNGVNTLTLLNGITENYNNPLIIPMSVGRLTQSSRSTNSKIATLNLNFRTDDNFEPDYEIIWDNNSWDNISDIYFNNTQIYWNSEDYDFSGLDKYRLSESFNHKPRTESGFINDSSLTSNVIIFDNVRGKLAQISPWNKNKISKTFNFVLSDKSDVDYLRLWFMRRSGMYDPVWIPSYTERLDFVKSANVTNIVDIRNYLSSNRKYLAIEVNFGERVVYREIASTQFLGGNVTRLTLIESVPTIYSDKVTSVYYATLNRLDNDSISIDWVDNNITRFELNFLDVDS